MQTDEEGFRFKSRSEYENALTNHLVKSGASEEYENLLEEYLRFCLKESDV